MEFKSGIEIADHSEHNITLADSVVIPVISGKSSDQIIDLELTQDPKVSSNDNLNKSAPEKKQNEVAGSSNSLWREARNKLALGRTFNGWITPVDSEADAHLDEDVVETELKHVQSEFSEISNINSLISKTLSEISQNNDLFKGQLNEVKQELLSLPVSINSLKTSIGNQEENLGEIKTASFSALVSLRKDQKELRNSLDQLSKIISGKLKAGSTSEKDEDKEFIKLSEQIDVLQTLHADNFEKIEGLISRIDLSKFQANLEIIYRAIKRLIDDSDKRWKISESCNQSLVKRISEIPQSLTAEDLVDLQDEVGLQLETVTRIEKQFDRFKRIQTIGFALIMLGFGVLISITLSL